MSYFSKFPKLVYDFNRDGVVNSVVDLFRQVRPIQNHVDNFSAYKFYSIKNGERPDIVSQRLYGSQNFYWTFFLINDFLHDGLSSWPMSQEILVEYINNEYNGFALETRPNIKKDTDGGITEFRNSLAGEDRFQKQGAWTVGKTVTGATSGATGTLRRKDLYLNQLVVQDVTGTFLGDGAGNVNEDVTGSWIDPVSGATIPCSVQCWKAWPYAEAPHHYYIAGDGDEIESHYLDTFLIDIAGDYPPGTTTFTLNSTPYDPEKVIVTIAAQAVSNWTINGTTLTFATAPADGTNIEVKVPITNPDGSQKYGIEAHVSNANFFSVDDDATAAERLVQQVGSTAAAQYTSNREYLFKKNEERSKIRIIDPAFIPEFVSKFESLINE
jgi:hypothetical protein